MTEPTGEGQPQQQPPPYQAPPQQGAHPPPQYPQHSAPPPAAPRKKRKIFLWFFLIVQALFLLWIVVGIGSTEAEDCGSLSQQACEDATAVGAGIGVFLIIVLWAFVDFILGLSYLIYRLARRN